MKERFPATAIDQARKINTIKLAEQRSTWSVGVVGLTLDHQLLEDAALGLLGL